MTYTTLISILAISCMPADKNQSVNDTTQELVNSDTGASNSDIEASNTDGLRSITKVFVIMRINKNQMRPSSNNIGTCLK